MLNTELVAQKIEEKGLKQYWMIHQTGLSLSMGYQFFREGILPKDAEKRRFALEKLAQILGVNQSHLVLHLEATTAQ